MLLTNEQARAVVKALAAPNCLDVEMHFNTEDGTIVVTAAGDLPVTVQLLGVELVPNAHEHFADLAHFCRAYGILPSLPPLECPIEKALSAASSAITNMQQRQPHMRYNNEYLWDMFDAAKKELQRLKGTAK